MNFTASFRATAEASRDIEAIKRRWWCWSSLRTWEASGYGESRSLRLRALGWKRLAAVCPRRGRATRLTSTLLPPPRSPRRNYAGYGLQGAPRIVADEACAGILLCGGQQGHNGYRHVDRSSCHDEPVIHKLCGTRDLLQRLGPYSEDGTV